MPFKVNHFPSKEKPDTVRAVYAPLELLSARSYKNYSRYSNTHQIRTPHVLHPNPFVPQSFENTKSYKCHETVHRRIIPEAVDDKYHTVSTLTANRLDIIALQYYDNASLWWVLADANPELRFNPYNIPRGTTIRIPSVTTLHKSGGVLDAR